MRAWFVVLGFIITGFLPPDRNLKEPEEQR